MKRSRDRADSTMIATEEGRTLTAAWRIVNLTSRGFVSPLSSSPTRGLDALPVCRSVPDHTPPAPGCSCGTWCVLDVADVYPYLVAAESILEYGLSWPLGNQYRAAADGLRIVVQEGRAANVTHDIPDEGPARLVTQRASAGRRLTVVDGDPPSTVRAAEFTTTRLIIGCPPAAGDRQTMRYLREHVTREVAGVIVREDPYARLSYALADWLEDGRPESRCWWEDREEDRR